jgi:glycosyltransferase involved in cell wall biosynthesis
VSGPGAPLRVALLLPCFWPEVRRGAERMARELADGLAARGQRPRILTSHPEPSIRSVEDGVEITRLRRPPEGWLRRRGYLEYLTHLPLAYADLSRRDDDVAMALYASDGLAAARWSRRTGRPSVLAYLGVPDRPGLTDRRLRLEVTARAARGCTAVTALSRAAADAFARWLDVTGVEVIPPPVDTLLFTPAGERASEPIVFCPAAVDDPRKRVPLLVRAMGRVCRVRPEARLVVSRPRDPAAAEAVESDGVEWADVDDRSALAEAYRRAWVTALPSFGEAFGLVLVESLACGTPVVGSRHGGIPEIVDDPAVGRTFPLDDEEALARALLEAFDLAADAGTPRACRARAEAFSVERCAAAYESLYRDLIR